MAGGFGLSEVGPSVLSTEGRPDQEAKTPGYLPASH